jgi:hypothetical protein
VNNFRVDRAQVKNDNSRSGAKRMNITRIKKALIIVFPLLAGANAESGSIGGEVKFSGAPPKLSSVIVSKDQDYCGEFLQNETYLVDSNGRLKNVVVFLDAVPAGAHVDIQKLNVVENNGCRYAPRITAMRKGERLVIRNNDPKLHIPHSYLRERTVFMLSLPFKNTALDATRKIREAGILKLVCDTHAWMAGYLHVFDHPYFAVTDEHGAFTISNVPAGRYTLQAWHEDAGVRTQEITVTENEEIRVGFEFSEDSPAHIH